MCLIEGVKEMILNVFEGYVLVVLEFNVGVNLDKVMVDVWDVVNLVELKLLVDSDELMVNEVMLVFE